MTAHNRLDTPEAVRSFVDPLVAETDRTEVEVLATLLDNLHRTQARQTRPQARESLAVAIRTVLAELDRAVLHAASHGREGKR